MTTGFEPRPRQLGGLSGIEGRVGLTDVPGTEKTWPLWGMGVNLTGATICLDDQEMSVVTLVNAVVRTILRWVVDFVQRLMLLKTL